MTEAPDPSYFDLNRGTMVNTGVSGDKLGSEANPIVINADANDDCGEHHAPQQDVSDGDTEPLSTPEFWATFDDGGSHVPQNNPKSALTNSNCDLTPCKSKYSQSPILSGSLELEFPHAYLEEERSEAANPPKIEDRASQNKDRSCHRKAETHAASGGRGYFVRSCQSDELPSIETSHPESEGFGKRRRGHGGEDYSRNRRSKRLAANRKMNG